VRAPLRRRIGRRERRIGSRDHRQYRTGGLEPFHGTIDELAFYDFALSPEEIAQHWANVRRRRGYFGAELQKADAVPDELGTRWRKVATLGARERVRFESRGGSVYGETVSGPREGSGF